MLRCLLLLMTGALVPGAVVMDRVAVIVGRHVVKTSDVERDLRATAFLNRQPLDFKPESKRKAADRLVEQELIRQEMMSGGYGQPTEQDAAAFLNQLRTDRFGKSDAALQAALAKYGLTQEQLKAYLLWQLTVLRFIDERFRPGVLVTEEDISAYYDEHRAELQKANPRNASLEALGPKIRETLTGERVNQSFEEWLTQTRRRTRVEFKDAAFQQ